MYDFRWIGWNIAHIDTHGVATDEAEHVVNSPSRGYPRRARNDGYLVWGKTRRERYLQVVYLIDPPPRSRIFVIHARDLTENEKRVLHRKSRR